MSKKKRPNSESVSYTVDMPLPPQLARMFGLDPELPSFEAMRRDIQDSEQNAECWALETRAPGHGLSCDALFVYLPATTVVAGFVAAGMPANYRPIALIAVDRYGGHIAPVILAAEDAKRLVNALGEAIALAEQMQAETGVPR